MSKAYVEIPVLVVHGVITNTQREAILGMLEKSPDTLKSDGGFKIGEVIIQQDFDEERFNQELGYALSNYSARVESRLENMKRFANRIQGEINRLKTAGNIVNGRTGWRKKMVVVDEDEKEGERKP